MANLNEDGSKSCSNARFAHSGALRRMSTELGFVARLHSYNTERVRTCVISSVPRRREGFVLTYGTAHTYIFSTSIMASIRLRVDRKSTLLHGTHLSSLDC